VTAQIDGIVRGALHGWAWDPARPRLRLDVSVWLDGAPLGIHRADRFRGDLKRAGIGDGGHGVACVLPVAQQDGAEHTLELRLADAPMAEPLARAALPLPQRAHRLQGRIERIADGALMGWVRDRDRPGDTIDLEMLIDGVPRLHARANRFRQDLLAAGVGSGVHGFVFNLAGLPSRPTIGTPLLVRATAAYGHWALGSIGFGLPALPQAAMPISDGRDLQDLARDAERRRDFSTAAGLLDAALVESPRDFEALFLRARVALALTDFDTARRMARKALAIMPGHLRPTILLARIAGSLGQHQEAIDHWDAVPPGDDAYREKLIKRAASLMALGRPLDAMGECSIAVGRDATDRDALRGLAEACEAAGGVAAALSHWQRYAALMPPDEALAMRMAQLAARLARPVTALSALRNPDLRQWQAPLQGEAGPAAITPTEGTTLRSLDTAGGVLRYAAAEPREDLPGDLPGYGLWLRVAPGGAEVAFALEAPAGETGLRMALELRLLGHDSHGVSMVEVMLRHGPDERVLLRHDYGIRPRLLSFDLRQDLPSQASWLVVRLSGPATLLLRPPRALCRLEAPFPNRVGFEDPALATWRFVGDQST